MTGRLSELYFIRSTQSHIGAVTGSTPKVQYAYTNGAANHARRTSITYPDNTVVALDYGSAGAVDDVLNRIKQLKIGATVLADYSYLGQAMPAIGNYSGQPGVELTYYTSGGSGDAGDQYTGLDRFGRIVDQRWRKTSDSTDRERVRYGYDRASNRQWRQNTVAGTGQDEYYTYDGLYQVKTLDRGTLTGNPPTGIGGTPSWEEDWNYDPTGNWRGSSTAYLTKVSGSTTLNQNRTHNKANEITDITETTGTAWPTPSHDGAGNLTQVPRPLSLGNSFDLTWDAWHRLVEVKNTGGAVVATYGYDGAHRRVAKVAGGNTRHYYYSDRWQVLEERLNALTTAERRFVWGVRHVDDLVLRDSGGTRHYALSDALGSVTAIVNTSATFHERYGYDGFGQPRYMDGSFGSRGSSSYTWETLFDGYRYDPESGLYQVRYRHLHPRLGRWLSRDPLEEEGGINLYGFAANNPILKADPLGLFELITPIPPGGPILRPGPQLPVLPPLLPPPGRNAPPPCVPYPECLEPPGSVLERVRIARRRLREFERLRREGRLRKDTDKWYHCVVSCELTRECGADWAQTMGDVHEFLHPGRDRREDQRANKDGRDCGECKQSGSCERCCEAQGYRR